MGSPERTLQKVRVCYYSLKSRYKLNDCGERGMSVHGASQCYYKVAVGIAEEQDGKALQQLYNIFLSILPLRSPHK